MLLLVSSRNDCIAGLNFDGRDDYFSVGDIDVSGAITIALWIYPTPRAASTYYWAMVVKRGSASPSVVNYGFDFSDTEMRFFQRQGGTWYIWETSNASLTTYTWQHVALVYTDGSAPVFYVNGASVTSSQTSGSGNPNLAQDNAATEIGRDELNAEWNEYFDGIMDDIRIYSRALSAQEIAILGKSKVRLGLGANLVGYWPLDDSPDGTSGDGDTIRDQSGNSYDGTGIDGGNNLGLTFVASRILSYP